MYKTPRPTAGPPPRTTSASGSSTRPSNTSAEALPSRNSTAIGDNDDPDPIILDYWTSGTHYAGGASANIAAGEDWSTSSAPFSFIATPSPIPKRHPGRPRQARRAPTAGNPAIPAAWTENALALWEDAVNQSKTEKTAWPYRLGATASTTRTKIKRGTMVGQLVLNDPQAASKLLPNLTVGLTHANYVGTGTGFQTRAGNGNIVTWPHDGDFYQFWTDGAADGRFTIPNVRPGTYTLRAFANGVLGEFAKADITVEAGKKIDLGKLDWQPVRFGKQVWEIGYPDRTGDKFFKGDGANYWLWGWPLRYGDLFPQRRHLYHR
jgi:rhamnogalacturonan endolyase